VRRALPLLLLVGVVACSSRGQSPDVDWTPVAAPDLGAIVARVGEVPIFANQVLAEAKRTGKPPRQALTELVTLHLLAEHARQAGRGPVASSEPEVETVLVQRLLDRELEPLLRPTAIPDSVLRPLYDRVRDRFVHSRLVDIGVLAIYTGALMKDAPRRERTATAKALAAYLEAHPPASLDAFADIAKDPAWSSRDVVYSRFLQSDDRPLSRVVGEQLVKLQPGETTRLLSDDDGFYLARYIGERPPENVRYQDARPKLLAGYLERWQQQKFLEYTDKLIQTHKVVAFFERLNEQGP
jgi:hypothetical protein